MRTINRSRSNMHASSYEFIDKITEVPGQQTAGRHRYTVKPLLLHTVRGPTSYAIRDVMQKVGSIIPQDVTRVRCVQPMVNSDRSYCSDSFAIHLDFGSQQTSVALLLVPLLLFRVGFCFPPAPFISLLSAKFKLPQDYRQGSPIHEGQTRLEA